MVLESRTYHVLHAVLDSFSETCALFLRAEPTFDRMPYGAVSVNLIFDLKSCTHPVLHSAPYHDVMALHHDAICPR